MPVLRIGWYPINSNTAQHTYAIMTKDDGKDVRFHCHGGTNDSGNQFPVNFWTPDSFGSKKMGTSFSCNERAARDLATWSYNVEWSRTDYDRNWIDDAGLVYAVTGVCHQMCNTIACSTNLSNPPRAGVNWPSSFSVSKLVYGFRGCGLSDVRNNAIVRFLRTMESFHKEFTFAGIEPSESAVNDLKKRLNEINLPSINALSARLKDGYDKNALSTTAADLWGEEALITLKQKPYFESISNEYQSAMNAKNELDNLLVRDQIEHKEYAGKVNALITKLALACAGALSGEEFTQVFSVSVEDAKRGIGIVDADFMPESYAGIKAVLGL